MSHFRDTSRIRFTVSFWRHLLDFPDQVAQAPEAPVADALQASEKLAKRRGRPPGIREKKPRQTLKRREQAALPAARLTAADLTDAQRREIFDESVRVLKEQLQATTPRAIVEHGKVLGHEEVPDNIARIKAIGLAFALLGSEQKGATKSVPGQHQHVHVSAKSFALPAASNDSVVSMPSVRVVPLSE